MRILKLSSIVLLFCFINISSSKEEVPRVPEWAEKAVWYQIFPERFWNGDTTNDPTLKDIDGGWPYIQPINWKVMPWTADWYKKQPWEEETEFDFYTNAGLRRYGGDLQGVLDRLDYLVELSITAIYFTPLFESPSLHKYDAKMYHHIDNNFGPNPSFDEQIWATEDPGNPKTWKWTSSDSLFLKLISECHNRKIKVIIDGVFNHVGNTFWAFQDLKKNQQQSNYKEWFTVNSWDDPTTENNEFDYKGWLNVKDLPELKEDHNGLVEGPREHVKAIVKRWMDPNQDGDPSDGIDGWRLDVAEMVNIKFWKLFRKWVKEINPEAYLTGEIWWENWQENKMFNASPWLQGDTFDAVMNYRFTRALKKFVIDKNNKIGVKAFVDSLTNLQYDYDKENLMVLMNTLGSHDTERLASLIVNPDNWYDHNSNPEQNKKFDVRKPSETEREKQKLIVGIQMTTLGAPIIYYGDEAGMWGGDDPDCRKPMLWSELKYEDEVSHPFDKKRNPDEVSFNKDLFNWYKKLIGIRKENIALSVGEIEFFFIEEAKNILGYIRKLDQEIITVIVNNKNEDDFAEVDLEFSSDNDGKLRDLITGKEFTGIEGKFSISLTPYQIIILK